MEILEERHDLILQALNLSFNVQVQSAHIKKTFGQEFTSSFLNIKKEEINIMNTLSVGPSHYCPQLLENEDDVRSQRYAEANNIR